MSRAANDGQCALIIQKTNKILHTPVRNVPHTGHSETLDIKARLCSVYKTIHNDIIIDPRLTYL